MARKSDSDRSARPFLKWAGGKTQLLDELCMRLPPELESGGITRYVEPFIGGGAVFFHLQQQPFADGCICDVNHELVVAYRTIKRSVEQLISLLGVLQSEYLAGTAKEKAEIFYQVRDSFNRNIPSIDFARYRSSWIERTAQIIFLNRTCFNGLFRVNRGGEFNVPFGGYERPAILNEANLRVVSNLLQGTEILHGDFSRCLKYADTHTFVYLDPPYRPLSQTSSFTSYSQDGFSDDDQRRLAEFFAELDARGAKVMLSNSDPRNCDPSDTFFDDLYADYHIARVQAKRRINCNGACRGAVSEIIVTNYPARTY